MPLKRIVLIIMCALLLLTIVMATVVIGRVAPTFQALLGGGKPVTKPTTTVTTPSTTVTQPTQPTTQATQPTMPPPTMIQTGLNLVLRHRIRQATKITTDIQSTEESAT